MKTTKLIVSGIIAVLFFSCTNFLDPYPNGDLAKDDIWDYQGMVQGLVEGKLKEAGLLKQCPQITVDEGESFPVGIFDLEFIAVTHSIPDGVAVAIRTPVGLVLPTGDFKFACLIPGHFEAGMVGTIKVLPR